MQTVPGAAGKEPRPWKGASLSVQSRAQHFWLLFHPKAFSPDSQYHPPEKSPSGHRLSNKFFFNGWVPPCGGLTAQRVDLFLSSFTLFFIHVCPSFMCFSCHVLPISLDNFLCLLSQETWTSGRKHPWCRWMITLWGLSSSLPLVFALQ